MHAWPCLHDIPTQVQCHQIQHIFQRQMCDVVWKPKHKLCTGQKVDINQAYKVTGMSYSLRETPETCSLPATYATMIGLNPHSSVTVQRFQRRVC